MKRVQLDTRWTKNNKQRINNNVVNFVVLYNTHATPAPLHRWCPSCPAWTLRLTPYGDPDVLIRYSIELINKRKQSQCAVSRTRPLHRVTFLSKRETTTPVLHRTDKQLINTSSIIIDEKLIDDFNHFPNNGY